MDLTNFVLRILQFFSEDLWEFNMSETVTEII